MHCEQCPVQKVGLRCRGRDATILGFTVPDYCKNMLLNPTHWLPIITEQAQRDAGVHVTPLKPPLPFPEGWKHGVAQPCGSCKGQVRPAVPLPANWKTAN
jgi:hypothetical protein